ncbi:ABC transporter permease [Actinocorallia sp. B10E7]|uniref:ABC transporter permease n=1 Tax=Actinocorallia sp. B10E7 TaxID=3153558 RepID=UPI00325CB3F3
MRALTGTRGLIRLALRRDRVRLPLWVLLLGLVPSSFVSATEQLYPTAAEQLQYARTTGTNPTFLALYGPLYDPGVGGIVVQRAGMLSVVIALISALTVIRHTRAEEEAGRRELLGATGTGRAAPLAAALAVAMSACLASGALVAAGMIGQGMPAAGSVAFGLQLVVGGWVFAAVAGLVAQLTVSAAAARGLSLAVLGSAFLIRMAADAGGPSWLAWASPLGWAQRLRPYATERWWPLAVAGAVTVALAWSAGRLAARRDLGAGMLPERLGPADAAPRLAGPFSLAWRLHGRTLYGWLAGFAALGAVYGGFAGGVQDMIADNPDLRQIFTRLGGEGGLVDAYFASVMGILGVIAAAYAVAAASRLRSEEAALLVEPLLATPTGRLRWASGHLAVAAAGSAAVLAAGGLAAGLVHGLNSGRLRDDLPEVFGAAMVQLPAVWLIAAICVALFGLLPRLTALSWAAVAAAGIIMVFGAALDLSQTVRDLSPFSHVPRIGSADFTPVPLIGLLIVAAVLTALGLAGFRRRDLALG